jgi:glycosyltransferase involved in cell wall biosynthesis
MEPPRVVWLHSHFQLPTGGTKYIYEVTSRLAEHLPLTVVVEDASDQWRERYASSAAALVEIGPPTSSSMAYWGAFPAFLTRDAWAVRRALSDADVVVSSFFPMPWVAARTRGAGVRHVTLCFEPFPFFHDSEVVGMYPPTKRRLLSLLKWAYAGVDRAGIASADRLLTLNESTAQQVRRVYGRTDAVPIYAGVDTALFRPYSAAEVAHLVGRFGDGPLCVHSTDYSPIKRTDLALESFALALRAVPAARLVITSTRQSAAEEKTLHELVRQLGIEHAVTFAGFLPFEDLPRLYSLATLVLQTGTAAGSGATTMALPVKEALACGTAVVRSAATTEDVEDGVSGYLVDPRDVETTATRIADLLGDPVRANAMGLAGRARIQRDYTWPRVVGRVLEAVLS